MRRYDLMLDACQDAPPGCVQMHAGYCDAVFGWATRHASGCKVEVFEDGASLGGLRLDADNGFWTVYPRSGRLVRS